jgi:hypothetical protein
MRSGIVINLSRLFQTTCGYGNEQVITAGESVPFVSDTPATQSAAEPTSNNTIKNTFYSDTSHKDVSLATASSPPTTLTIVPNDDTFTESSTLELSPSVNQPEVVNDVTYPRSDGRKPLKKKPGCKHTYFKCTHEGYRAKYHVTLSPKGHRTTLYLPQCHNHLFFPDPHLRSEVKEKACLQLSAGACPTVVHTQIVNNASLFLSPADVPTIGQLKYWKYKLVLQEMPTSMFSFLFFSFFAIFLTLQKVMPSTTSS